MKSRALLRQILLRKVNKKLHNVYKYYAKKKSKINNGGYKRK